MGFWNLSWKAKKHVARIRDWTHLLEKGDASHRVVWKLFGKECLFCFDEFGMQPYTFTFVRGPII